MRKPSRNTIKWSGTVLTVMLVVVWVGSAWWAAGFLLPPTVSLFVFAGRVNIGWKEPWSIIPVDGLWQCAQHSFPFSWWFDVDRARLPGVTYTDIAIPI